MSKILTPEEFAEKGIYQNLSNRGNRTVFQCPSLSGHGPDKLYCTQHGRMVEG